MNIKQGQTIYEAIFDISTLMPSFRAIFLHSKNQELSPPYCRIDKMPVNHMRKLIKSWGSKGYFHSRRRALTEYKKLQRKHNEVI